MKLLFVSDALNLDEDFVPLAELMNLEDPVSGRAMAVARENSSRIKAAHMKGNAGKQTFFFRMPEDVLVQWQSEFKVGEDVSPLWIQQQVTNLFAYEHPQWVPMRPYLPMVMMFFTHRISVLTTKGLTVIHDKENPDAN